MYLLCFLVVAWLCKMVSCTGIRESEMAPKTGNSYTPLRREYLCNYNGYIYIFWAPKPKDVCSQIMFIVKNKMALVKKSKVK